MDNLNERRIAEEIDELMAVTKRMLDAYGRQNHFDMMKCFDELRYTHVMMLKDVCGYEDTADELEKIANSIALDDGLSYSITHEFIGKDMGELRRKALEKRDAMIKEDMELIKTQNDLLENGLERVKRHKDFNMFLKGMLTGELIIFGTDLAKKHLPKIIGKLKH